MEEDNDSHQPSPVQTPPPSLNTHQPSSPAQLDPQNTPSVAHLDCSLPVHLDPHQIPLLGHLGDLQNAASAYLDPSQSSTHQAPSPAHLNSQLPAHQDPNQAPLLAHPDLQQTPTTAHRDLEPPVHPDPNQTSAHLEPQLPAHLDLPQTLTDPNPHQTPTTAHRDLEPPVRPDLNQTSAHLEPQLPAHLDLPQTLTDPNPHQTSTSALPYPHETPAPAHNEPPPPAELDHQQAFLPAHLDPHPAPHPAHLDLPQTPTLTDLDPHQISTSAHLEPQQTHTPVHLDFPACLDPCKTPTIAHLDLQPSIQLNHCQTPPPAHLDPHQAPVTAQLDPYNNPTPAHPDPNQTLVLAHPDLLQASPLVHLDPQLAPLSSHLDLHSTPTPAQTPPPAHLDDPHQAPPPAHLAPHQIPLPVHWDFPGTSEEPKLCGFLQKQGGPLRAWKRRWFTYEEKQNQMFYYRTPQDVTPLGRVDLSSATFTYPLKAEMGTFHIETPERTYTLKAVTQDLMLYWLQQLQLKRWQHRQNQTNACPDATSTDDFLPMLKSPAGLVGEEAASESPQRTPLANMSIKHPFIQIQNTVHSFRKRSSQEWPQSVFYVQAPAGGASAANGTGTTSMSPAGLVGRAAEDGASGAPLDSPRRKKNLSSSTRTATMSSETVSRLRRDKEMLTEEVKAQKELVWLLHKTLEAAQREKRTCADFMAAEGEQERLELLRHRERQAADLLGRVERAQAAAEATRRDLDQRDLQVAQLQDEIRKLTEENRAKREVIIKLSEHVAACVSAPPSWTPPTCAPDSLRQLKQRVEDLKDDIEAYKTQNKFLNSEIFQLTKLWRKSSEQERSLMVKCAYLEAWQCQAESRYLGVLRELQENRSLDPDQQRTIQKMVEDALQGQAKNIKASTNSLHDEYGFKIIPDYEVEDVKLLAKIQALEIRSHNLLRQEGRERPLLSRWAQYLAGRSDDDFCPSPELKGLLRAGVPPEYRQRVWRCLVRIKTRVARERHPQRYQELCDKSHTCPHPASRQIQLDLHRTLTSNRNFSSPSSPAHQQLQRILLAFSWQNPSIGYCQGLNRLAAIALLVLQSEEDAFWCVVAVVDAIMPQDYYTKNLLAAQADQHVLKDFLVEKLPRLAAHFDLHGTDVSLVSFNWFLVVFVESLPSDILLPLWDAFLYEGTKVMFRYALALFKYKEDDILKIHNSVDIYQYLRFFTKTITDARKLMGMAFADMNPFPGRLLKNRRALHLERLQRELRELEEQQKAFAALSGDCSQQQDNQMDNGASDDDEGMS
ncbi:TBC1 domain family member 2A [Syngnathus scovelli]|uniref:TBC1 domain family member 2A n=1 Tax=Syngnathus scovelli TaxID=161590 RepID=UPI00210F9BA7|nr:TBC1 domain family member 2A isoform X1 [Syngnathus scovelli]XP_049612820.1 TBC1 domain family member 2A isoform X1 [Syngnathus scovelli]XP_049612828.1 TBC1 domain family member 2A isoform X1 [Syngnathus scovelli]